MCNVVSAVVAKGACTGCGVCAGVAPNGCLSMALNTDGEYAPTLEHCTECGLCLRVCPQANPQEPGADWPLGELIEGYVGYSKVGQERAHGSSGGLATRVLCALMESGAIDGAVAVVPTGRPDRLFEPRILRSQAELLSATGSKYYPVEFSGALQALRDESGAYAVVGLPCVVAALRRAQQNVPWVRERLRYVFGLACGHGVSTHYTAFLACVSGVSEAPVTDVRYRDKAQVGPATRFGFVATGADGRAGRRLPFSGSIASAVWNARLFTADACFDCADLFAPQADAVFMDAWLPDYVGDPRGTSIVVTRSEEIDELLQAQAGLGHVELHPLTRELVITSQAGPLGRKKRARAARASRTSTGMEARLVRVAARQTLGFGRRRSRLAKWLMRSKANRMTIGVRVIHALGIGAWVSAKMRGAVGKVIRRTVALARRRPAGTNQSTEG